MRLVSCRFAAVLPILTFSVLALAQGTTPSQTQLLPPASPTAGQVGFAVHVRPGASVQPPFTAPAGTVTLYNGTTAVVTGGTQPARLNVMLNLGTGFGSPQAIDTSAIPDMSAVSIAFTDLNNDGKQDLVFSYQAFGLGANNGVATLLGNGDGTFAAPVNFTIGTSAVTPGSPILPLVTEDVDADGNRDVVLGSGVLLMGKGDGTLTAGTPLFTSTVAFPNPPPAYALLT